MLPPAVGDVWETMSKKLDRLRMVIATAIAITVSEIRASRLTTTDPFGVTRITAVGSSFAGPSPAGACAAETRHAGESGRPLLNVARD